jgi:hypothetical protein
MSRTSCYVRSPLLRSEARCLTRADAQNIPPPPSPSHTHDWTRFREGPGTINARVNVRTCVARARSPSLQG